MGQAWLRNPLTYIRECAEVLAPNYAWDRGYAIKMRVDPQRHLELHLPRAVQYRLLYVGEQGTAEVRRGGSLRAPRAVYPTWEYGSQTFDQLEDMLANPAGAEANAPRYAHLPVDERPVIGQEHRVVVTRWPAANTVIGKGFLKALAGLQDDYPEAIIHIHGTYSFRVAFGMGFGAGDIDPRQEAGQGKLMLPNGKKINHLKAPEWAQWITLMGFKPSDMAVPRNRCMFNIKSALWAADQFEKATAFTVRRGATADPTAATTTPVEVTGRPYRGNLAPGDKFVCNACSVAPTCKYFRDGGVCAIPDSETSELARLFGTRDSDRIIEGVSALQQMMVSRAESAYEVEQIEGKMNPETTKVLNAAFNNGVKLAKLVDPALAAAGATKVGILVQGAHAGTVTAQSLTAGIVGELTASGIKLEDITEEMIAARIAAASRPAIEASSRPAVDPDDV